jgi:prepilin-type N-terminal cleavage/methylation domain-containing protein
MQQTQEQFVVQGIALHPCSRPFGRNDSPLWNNNPCYALPKGIRQSFLTYFAITTVINLFNPKPHQGFSFIELMIIIIILGIIAAVAIPNFSSSDPAKLDNAANEVKAAILFAQAEAIRTKIPYGIIIDAANDRLRVYSLPAATPVYNVYHPIDKKLYDLQLKTDAYISGVDLISAAFSFAGSFSSSTNLEFNSDGYPKFTSGGADYLLTSSSIILSYHDKQSTVVVAPITGRVTVQ